MICFPRLVLRIVTKCHAQSSYLVQVRARALCRFIVSPYCSAHSIVDVIARGAEMTNPPTIVFCKPWKQAGAGSKKLPKELVFWHSKKIFLQYFLWLRERLQHFLYTTYMRENIKRAKKKSNLTIFNFNGNINFWDKLASTSIIFKSIFSSNIWSHIWFIKHF